MQVHVGKIKIVVVGRERVAALIEFEMNEEIMEVVSSFKSLGSCFSKDGGRNMIGEMSVGEGLKPLINKHDV